MQHVTKVEPAGAGHRAVCKCGWNSDEHPDRVRALAAARMHRTNENVQKL